MNRTQTAKAVHLKDYQPFGYEVESLDLNFILDPNETLVTASAVYRRKKETARKTPLELDGDGLDLVSVEIDGSCVAEARYTATADSFTLIDPPETFTLTIRTRVNPTANTALSGLYRSGGTYCTQCEAQGFRRITYFPDRPDVLTTYSVRMEAEKSNSPVLLSNGNPVKKGKLKNGRHYAIWHDPHPKPSYLFALVAGDLGSIHRSFKTSEGRKARLGIYVEKGKEARAAYAMDALVRSMRWDEEVFGCAYDLDVFNIVAISDFNMGAMENKGLNIFNDKYVLADKDSASDGDFANIEAIIAHEYFHNWTGNRITCRDWFQLCLKEGLTVYRDQEFSSDMRSRAVQRIEDVVTLRSHQFPEDAGPLAHSVRPNSYREINNFYTATVYEKGAEIVRMLFTLLGENRFRAGMARYLKKHDGDAATVEDFIACFETAARVDLAQFFLWYEQAGTPVLHIGSDYDAGKKTFTVQIEQSLSPTPGQPSKKLMHMPVRIGLIGSSSGRELSPARVSGAEHRGDMFEIRQRKHRLVFHGIEERPVLSVNRGFSSPVEINYRHSDKELIFLTAFDQDPYSRWQALRTIASKQIMSAMRAIQRRKKPVWNQAFLDTIVEIAADETLEPAFRALMLTLPGESEIARMIGKNIDPDAIHAARNALQSAIGEKIEPVRETVSSSLKPASPYSPDAEDAGKRALSNLLLSFGIHANSEKAEVELLRRFKATDNMTDLEFGLRMILQEMGDTDHYQAALDAFHDRFKNDHIVLDKWFMLQATLPGKHAVTIARGLTGRDDFVWTNPNRVRSVVGAFATANPTGFNRKDGAGYRFVTAAIAKLDKINPQVAARLLTAFRSWKQLESQRRSQAEKALRDLKSRKGLSKDVSEILDRTLA